MISKRAKVITPSLTLDITSKAKKMKKEGKDVVILAAGEPDFPTPQRIKRKAFEAIDNNFTTYTATGGIPELKEALAKKFLRDNGLNFNKNEIMVNCGGKQALYLVLQCLLNPGDKVVVNIPCWNSYIEQIKLASGEPVKIMPLKDMSFNIEGIRQSITKDTKALILNSPL